ncbi:SDR family NAD(P)-dependent oxidoreductase [Rhodobium gokarnense]|uniref:Short-subunit dehydrogenase n=1 Tax=Rhodobium gokarnense TaxID=364296 RepID=A0ABT3HER7_9HYPH|nr:SDR family NAD(P)-dependent oxidoreductase [Rhodobium gokarnense]MCW2308895.1 short-subunit dehydrogenase [Rhodobium gokarnense]
MADTPWNSVWITGASSGIGLELARLMADEAPHVAISARSADALEAAAASHAALAAYPLDVTDADAVKATAERITAEAGPIDLAVLGAGTWKLMDAEDFDLAAVRTGMEVNYMGVANAVAALLPGMLSRGSGHIVIVASVAGYRGLPKAVAYGPTKAALINLAETLKAELAPHGIKVSVVNPGFVDTPMTRDNPFPMPGIIPARDAARALLSGLEKGRYEIVFPTGFVMGMKVLRLLPNALFFWIVRKFILTKAK